MAAKNENVKPVKSKGGRPALMLDQRQLLQVEALGAFLTLEQVADYFEMSRPAFALVRERQPEVDSHYKKGRTKVIKNIANSLITQARKGNLTAIIFYLKTQAGWRETESNEKPFEDLAAALVTLANKLPG